MTSTAIVAYLALFAAVGFVFVLATLILGWFLRPNAPTPMKLEAYECGEPPIGPSNVQFDLRFYVIALVFIIFEVEVALFFPTATIFGKASHVLNPAVPLTETLPATAVEESQSPMRLNPAVAQQYRDLGVPAAAVPLTSAMPPERAAEVADGVQGQFQMLARAGLIDLAVFFAVLLVGFAFVWSRGDLEWVRATRHLPTPDETAMLAQHLRSDTSR